ncbi:cobalamin biosynthesis protein CobT [Duganella sp. FT27W]|uniref:cobaltochelatase CobT-related protein n=1 Tax=Duganella sp. FT27W TaxID=2654636 RepID=UPI00128C8D29|nr:cobalamin biosynthesis protein CobT [Duganella sp. FT27W]MPQ56338.1 cobalamin biosynthesis protein CobT [Duganella sp. FT27W]
MNASHDRIHIIREAVTKLVPMLTDKKVLVTQRGISAFVKTDASGRPIQVNLPYIPDNATEELIDAIQGFLDHEVAHILFTDFSVLPKAAQMGVHSLFNIIEDARIEKAMADRFRGSGTNIGNTAKFFLEKFTKPKMEEAIAAGDEAMLTSVLMVPLIRGMAGQTVWSDFMADKMHHVQDTYDKIKGTVKSISGAKSSADALKAAGKVMEAMTGHSPAAPSATPPAPPPPPKSSGTSGKRGKPGAGVKAAPKHGPSEEDAPPAEEEDDDAPTSAATAAPAEEGTPDDEDDGAPAEADEDDASIAGSGDEEMASERDDEATEDVAETNDEGGVTWEKIEKHMAADFDDTTSNLITNGVSEAAKGADYLVFTRDKDIVEPLVIGKQYAPEMFKRISDDVDHMVGPLQKDLERAISARSLSSWSPGHRSGRVNASSLHRLATGDDRVFRRKQITTTKDVAVELVIDMSGSMSGSKIHTAAKAAYALASVLDRIGIANEVICFTTGEALYSDESEMNREEAKLGRRYSRRESLYMPILKKFAERMSTDVKSRFGWLPNTSSMSGNVDGESIEVAARRLMGRKEKGKIMMVLSDGAPAASGDCSELQEHLKKTVENITRAGVNVIGIGIQSTEVKKFYPKSLILNDVKDLPIVVMKQLRELILK